MNFGKIRKKSILRVIEIQIFPAKKNKKIITTYLRVFTKNNNSSTVLFLQFTEDVSTQDARFNYSSTFPRQPFY